MDERDADTGTTTRKLLVAVDETEGSQRAAAFVDRFFGGMDVAVTAVNVTADPTAVPPVVPFGVPYGGIVAWGWGAGGAGGAAGLVGTEEERRAAMERAEAVAHREAPAGAEVEVRVGDPVEAIAAAAEEVGADLIVVGSNERGVLDRLVGGSVSRGLVKDAPCPVLVVR